MEYIGQTTNTLEYRFKAHCKESRNRHISNAIRMYGEDNFSIVEIAVAKTKEELNDLELKYVEELNTLHPNGYNHRAGGNQNGKCSEELKRKISLAKTGKPILCRRGEVRSQEQRLKISRTLGGKQVLATEISTGKSFILNTVREGINFGFNPSNIVSVCKKVRPSSKGYVFRYIENDVNQSGSTENKSSEHAQRIEGEPTSVEYNPSTSHLPLIK